MPLIFGTLKATFYSMLFGVPLALGAALYTSEFMRPAAEGQDQAGDGNDGQPAERGAGFSGRCRGGAVCGREHRHDRLQFFTVPTALVAGPTVAVAAATPDADRGPLAAGDDVR